MKKFATVEELRSWIDKRFYTDITVDEMILGSRTPSDDDIIAALIEDGYTDLDDLVADGHAYQIGAHKNNGWIFEDEADLDYIKSVNRNVEIRTRKA